MATRNVPRRAFPLALIKLAAILVFGPAPIAVLISEIMLKRHLDVRSWQCPSAGANRSCAAPFCRDTEHAPRAPLYRSARDRRNFGFNVRWWDRLFGTYRAQPALGHDRMTIGIDRFREPREL